MALVYTLAVVCGVMILACAILCFIPERDDMEGSE